MPIWLLQDTVTVKMTKDEANVIGRAAYCIDYATLKLGGLTSKEIEVFAEFRDKLLHHDEKREGTTP